MKNSCMAILFSAVCLLGACSMPPDSVDDPATVAPYLGQQLPGDSAVLFAPGLVSIEGRYEYGVSFSPEGRELLFSTQDPEGPSVLMHFIAANGGWVGPREVHLSDGQRAEEMEAFFTPDGRRIYFAAYNEGLDVRIWAVDRDRNGWRSPRQLGSPLADDPAFFPTTTADGAVYYSNLTERRIFRAEVTGDSVVNTEDTGLEAMHAFVAPDESLVLLDVRDDGEGEDSDIFVSFRRPDGSWSPLVDLGPGVNTEFDETCPSLSHDGRFIFFSRYDEPNEVSNVYWVSSTLLQVARESLGG
jgi:Tol biopolymer transport system component